MEASQHTAGQTVYDRDGRKLYFRRDLGDGSAIVSRWLATEGWDGEAEEYVSDEPIIATVAQLFRSPPTEVLANEVVELNGKIANAREELGLLQYQAKEAEAERKRFMDALTSVDPLRNIEDFIAGRITHFVVCDCAYASDNELFGDVKVEAFDKTITKFNDYGRAEGMKLLSLYGDSKGKLDWRVSHYSDGSGSHKIVIPCLSEEEARAKAAEALDTMWANYGTTSHSYRIDKAIQSADALGFPVPKAIRASRDAKVIEDLTSNVEKARQALAVAEAQLAAASPSEEALAKTTGAA